MVFTATGIVNPACGSRNILIRTVVLRKNSLELKEVSSHQQDKNSEDQETNVDSRRLHWLLVDMNSYFASVEQQMNPKYRGKPLAVVPTIADTTSCIAASIEAKKFGVKTGTMVSDARKMCPGIVFIKGDHNNYIRYHEKIVEAVESCLPVTSVMSIDEMACRLTGRDQNPANALELANEIRRKIFLLGSELRCSIGISTNRFLAKIASDMRKPDGLTFLFKEDLPDSLLHLTLRDLPGVGRNMEQRLNEQNIKTMAQLIALDQKGMRNVWKGVWGDRMYQWLRGTDLELSESARHSISHSSVLAPALRNDKGSYAVLQKLTQKAAVRLRKMDLWCGRLSISVRYMDRTSWSKEVKMLECQDTQTLLEVVAQLWTKRQRKAPLKVSVWFTDLIETGERTFSLFEDKKRQDLSRALDKLNVRYGKDTLYFGGVHEVKSSAPTRIAFTNIPETED